MFVEDLTIGPCRGRNCAAGKAGHDLQKNCGMIFRLRLSLEPFDTDLSECPAKVCERAPMEESGQVVGRIWEQFAAAE